MPTAKKPELSVSVDEKNNFIATTSRPLLARNIFAIYHLPEKHDIKISNRKILTDSRSAMATNTGVQ